MTGIKLEAGKTYLDREGNKYGPLVHNLKEVGTLYEYSLGVGKFSPSWRADGLVYGGQQDQEDLVEEVVEVETTMRNSLDWNDKNVVPDWNNGTIHGWNGGDCPVHPETRIKFWTDEGGFISDAGHCRWDKDTTGLDPDIIAFRVVKQHVEPKVLWVVEEEDRINWVADNEAEAWRYAGKDPENRRVVKYMECKE